MWFNQAASDDDAKSLQEDLRKSSNSNECAKFMGKVLTTTQVERDLGGNQPQYR